MGGDYGRDVAVETCGCKDLVERAAAERLSRLPTLSAAISGSLPRDQAGVGAGLQAATREFGSALGVAVIGTVLTARFVHELPVGLRGEHTVAQALAAEPASAHQILTAFVAGADAGLRVIGIAVLVIGCLVTAQSLLTRRSR